MSKMQKSVKMVDSVQAFKAIFHLSLLTLATGQCADTHGKEFVLGFMQNKLREASNHIYVTTSKDGSVNVEVTSPNWKDPYLHEQFSIIAGEVKKIIVGSNFNLKGTELSTKGILVKASDEVNVYGVSMAYKSTDAFLGISTDALGTEYFAVAYFDSINPTEFLIAGTKNCTRVNVQLTSNIDAKDVVYNGATYKPGDTITLVMNRYDTFQIKSNGDLTGSYVTSDKPISFFSGNYLSTVGEKGERSHLVEQLMPVKYWGNRFATMPTPLAELGDYFRIVASSETNLSYTCNHNGNMQTTDLMLKNAEVSQILIGTGMICYWESDYPILLVQFSSGNYRNMNTDATMMMIPAIEQYSADYIFTTPKSFNGSNFQSFFIFIAKTQEVQGLMLDDSLINMTHNTVPKSDLSIGYFKISPGVHFVRHTSSVSVFGGLLYGQTRSESYGFPLGLRLPEPDVRGVCSSRYPCQKNSGYFEKVRQTINIKSGAIWEAHRIESVSVCATLCVRDCKCASYSYHEEKKICRGQGWYTCTSLDKNNSTAEEGWGFWFWTNN